jgi:hypothetical protein
VTNDNPRIVKLGKRIRKGRIKVMADVLGVRNPDLGVGAMLRLAAALEERSDPKTRPIAVGAQAKGQTKATIRKRVASRRARAEREARERAQRARRRRVAEGPGFYGASVWETGRGWPAALEAIRLIPDGPFRIRAKPQAVGSAVAAGFVVVVRSGVNRGSRVINRDSGIRHPVKAVYRITPLGRMARDWAQWCWMRHEAGYPAPAHGVARIFAHVAAWVTGGDVDVGKTADVTAGYASGDWCDAPWPGAGASWAGRGAAKRGRDGSG